VHGAFRVENNAAILGAGGELTTKRAKRREKGDGYFLAKGAKMNCQKVTLLKLKGGDHESFKAESAGYCGRDHWNGECDGH
jgi:hypothetical protein